MSDSKTAAIQPIDSTAPMPPALPALELPFKVTFDKETKQWSIPPEHEASVASLYGVHNYALGLNLFLTALNATPIYEGGAGSDTGISPNAVNAFMQQMQPANPVETMLLSQMLTIHQHTMKTGQRLTNTNKIVQIEGYTRQLNQLARTFTAQVDALNKLRNGGKQTVQVLHQHVQAEPGSQVMVGQQAKA